jgi:predicted NAD/FAD-binding protein
MRIAIVGGGIAGLGTAWLLNRRGFDVTLFEAASRAGGHSATVDVTVDGRTFPVDTGFLVYNERTYPLLVSLFRELGVETVGSDMSFSCRVDAAGLEWAGANVATLFAQRRNALRPAFWQMLRDVLRFNREATALAQEDKRWHEPLGEFLARRAYSRVFRDWYLLPMAAAIWSSPRRDILDFPVSSFVAFCHNHGLLQLSDRPQWRTVSGGSRSYVERIVGALPDVRLAAPVVSVHRHADHVDVVTQRYGTDRFDEIVLACHTDQSRAILADPTPQEDRLLAAVRYQPNRVVLHTDPALLPRSKRAWSAWNYLAAHDPDGARPVAVSYLINKLQPLPCARPVIVTLNPPFEPAPGHVIGEYEFAHPVIDARAVASQRALAAMQGARRTWFAGAWMRYGFHEDGLASAHAVADGLSVAADAVREAA